MNLRDMVTIKIFQTPLVFEPKACGRGSISVRLFSIYWFYSFITALFFTPSTYTIRGFSKLTHRRNSPS